MNPTLSRKAKNYIANLTKAILGIELGIKIEEFEKADIIVKTVRLKEKNDLPSEHISFPAFKFKNIIKDDWEKSNIKNIPERKFFFVFINTMRRSYY